MPPAPLITPIRPHLTPWTYKARRLLGKRALKLADVAERRWEVAPGITQPPYQIFIDPRHLDRILDKPNGETREQLIESIQPKQHVAAPSTAFLLRDVVLAGGNLYAGMYKHDLYPAVRLPPERRLGPVPTLDSAVFTGGYTSARWFAHLMYDEFPLQMLAADVGPMVTHRRRIYHHEPRWRELFGLPLPPAYDAFVARELILIEDYGQNPSKRQRYGAMRGRLRHLPAGHERIYLRRSSTGGEARRLVNEEELIPRLEREGFHIVEPAAISVDQLLAQCMHAKVVLSVDGSHAAPAYYFGADGAKVMFLLPPQRVTPLMACMCTMHGMSGGLFIGEPVNDDAMAFRVDIEELMQTLCAFLAS